MSSQPIEHQTHVYYKITFFKYDDNGKDMILLSGRYLEEHFLNLVNVLAEFYFTFFNLTRLHVRIEKKKALETEFYPCEDKSMEVVH